MQSKPGNNKQPKVIQNRTMENTMRQKTKGEDWGTARKKLITEALKNKPRFIKDHMQAPRAQPRPQRKGKKCKNCPK